MNKINFLWKDFQGWSSFDYAWLFVANFAIIIASMMMGDTIFGMFSAVVGTVCVILVAKGKLSNYIWGTVAVLTYGYLAYTWGYYGEFMLNYIYYLPMQFIGFYLWYNKMYDVKKDENEVSEAKSLTLKQIIFVGVTSLIGISLYSVFLNYIEGRLPILDATTTVLSVIAMILMALRFSEQWLMWIGINVITIYMWTSATLEGQGEGTAILMMWIVYLLNSIYGYIMWKRHEKIQKEN